MSSDRWFPACTNSVEPPPMSTTNTGSGAGTGSDRVAPRKDSAASSSPDKTSGSTPAERVRRRRSQRRCRHREQQRWRRTAPLRPGGPRSQPQTRRSPRRPASVLLATTFRCGPRPPQAHHPHIADHLPLRPGRGRPDRHSKVGDQQLDAVGAAVEGRHPGAARWRDGTNSRQLRCRHRRAGIRERWPAGRFRVGCWRTAHGRAARTDHPRRP